MQHSKHRVKNLIIKMKIFVAAFTVLALVCLAQAASPLYKTLEEAANDYLKLLNDNCDEGNKGLKYSLDHSKVLFLFSGDSTDRYQKLVHATRKYNVLFLNRSVRISLNYLFIYQLAPI